jgi:hypothetical protein
LVIKNLTCTIFCHKLKVHSLFGLPLVIFESGPDWWIDHIRSGAFQERSVRDVGKFTEC